ncbi:MAG: proton-conducting transporter membrane subunit [Chloroflexota bacterium]
MFVLLPLLITFITAIACFVFWSRTGVQRIISLVGSSAALAAAVILLIQVTSNGILSIDLAGWEAPFGITLVADLFSAIMVVVTTFMGLMVAFYSLEDIDLDQEKRGYHPLYQFMLTGVIGSFLTGDIFNLFVMFEIMLISSFALLSLMGRRPQIEGALKYVIMNMVASFLFLASVGLLFGVLGTVNMADLALRMPEMAEEAPALLRAIAMLFMVAFGMKAALFPMFGWLPASYHTPPTAVTTIFGALLTKVGVYALIRLFTLIFAVDAVLALALPVLLVFSALTMVTGVFGAVSQYDFRRLLSFHIISQIGYLIMGLGLFTVASLAGTIFFMVHVILAKAALFLVSGIVNSLAGTYDLKKLGGFYNNDMALSMLFFIPAMALAGIPPLSGFWAKFAIIRAGILTEEYWIVAVGLFVSVWTLYSMTKIWRYVFMRKRPEELGALTPLGNTAWWLRWSPTIAIGLTTVLLGIFAGPLFDLSTQAAEQLLDPTRYIEAILPPGYTASVTGGSS